MLKQKQVIGGFILSFVLISIYVFIFSDSGVLMRNNLIEKKYVKSKRIEILKQDRNKLRAIYHRYRKGLYTSNDLLDAGYIGPDDAVVFLKDGLARKRMPVIEEKLPEESFQFHFYHLQIFWLVLSFLVLLLYFSIVMRRSYPTNEEEEQ